MFFNTRLMMSWITLIGCGGVGAVIFAQTAFFFCFFLPGDSLLFIAGLLSAKGYFNIITLVLVAWSTAWCGYLLAFTFGEKFGQWLELQPDSFCYKRQYLEKTKLFFAKHGKSTVFLAFFAPVIRTFTPVVMGMASYPMKRFALTALIGSFGWAILFSMSGYLLGVRFPSVVHYLLPLTVLIIAISLLPSVLTYCRRDKV
jgi:membrane-associated protein